MAKSDDEPMGGGHAIPMGSAPKDEAVRQSRLVAFVLAATTFMVVIDATVLLTALPRMAQDFAVPVTMLSATITIYLMVTVVLLPVSNWIGQRFGTRRIYMIAIIGFVCASIGAGLSQSLPTFLLMRMCQAAFGTLMVPVGNIVLLTITPKRYLVTAMAISTTPALIAPVIGPPIGGFITTFLDWRWVFFLNAPTGVLALLLTLRFVPNIHSTERAPFDFKGLVLTSSSLICLIAGFDRAGAKGGGLEIAVPLLAAALLLGSLAWRHSRAAAHPIVPLGPLRYPSFLVATFGAGMMVRIAFIGTSFLVPLMLQIGLGLSPFHAGLLLLAQNAGDLVLKGFTSRALRFFGFRTALISGALMISASLVVCAMLPEAAPFWLLLIIMFGVGLARSIHMTAMVSLRFADVPNTDVGGATVLGNLANSIAQAFAISAAAGLLNLISHGANEPNMDDFRIAIAIFAVLALCATPFYARLAKDVGASLTGRSDRGLRAIRNEEV